MRTNETHTVRYARPQSTTQSEITMANPMYRTSWRISTKAGRISPKAWRNSTKKAWRVSTKAWRISTKAGRISGQPTWKLTGCITTLSTFRALEPPKWNSLSPLGTYGFWLLCSNLQHLLPLFPRHELPFYFLDDYQKKNQNMFSPKLFLKEQLTRNKQKMQFK